VAAGILAATLTACSQVPGREAATPAAPPITVAVSRGEVEKTVTAPGQLVGTRETTLSLAVAGRLVEFTARPGRTVRAGDVLARLDAAPYEAALTRAQVTLAQATAEHEHQLAALALAAEGDRAQVDGARAQFAPLTAAELQLQSAREAEQRALNEYNKALDRAWESADAVEGYRLEYVAAQRRREIAESDLTAAQNQRWAAGEEVAARQVDLERTEADLTFYEARGVDPLLTLSVSEAEDALAATVLTAPFDGVVLEVFANPGEALAAGQPLLLLADLEAVEVQTRVIEEDLPLVAVGQPAELYFDAQPDVAARGRVDRVVPRRIAGEDRPLYTVFLTLLDAPPPGVYPGMTVDASILIESRDGALRLPRALVRGGDSAAVDLWRGGGRVSQTVDVGLRGDVYTEILSGLNEGDEVIAE
jgi:multidrug efflux pump subunit AcrA (membrane-fusion protein)